MKILLSALTLAIATITTITKIPLAVNAQPQDLLMSETHKAKVIQYNCLTKEVWSADKQLWCQQLANTEWLLEDLNGKGVIDNLQSTIQFMPNSESDSKTIGHIAGNGGCNRYNADLKVKAPKTDSELSIQVGVIASTLMMCPPAIADQEQKFLDALGRSYRLKLDGSFLLIYARGIDKPLKFTQLTAKPTPNPNK
jgi:heat shock protein HslJ